MSLATARAGVATCLEKQNPLPAAGFFLGFGVIPMSRTEIVWPPVGRGRYGVDADGNVYSKASGDVRRLKPARRHGYLLVFLSFGLGDKKRVPVHRLVALAFLSPDPNRPHVNHKNGVKHDNRATNLEWVTPRENSLHALTTGLYQPPRKFSEDKVQVARSMRACGAKLKDVAAHIGCSITRAHVLTAGVNSPIQAGAEASK